MTQQDISEKTTIEDYLKSPDLQVRIDSKVNYYLNAWSKITSDFGDLSISDTDIIKKINSKISFNWAGMLFSALWGVWRGISISWYILCFICLAIIFSYIPIIDQIGNKSGIGFAIVFGLYGNSFYLTTLIKSRNDSIESVKPSLIRVGIALAMIAISIFIGVALDESL